MREGYRSDKLSTPSTGRLNVRNLQSECNFRRDKMYLTAYVIHERWPDCVRFAAVICLKITRKEGSSCLLSSHMTFETVVDMLGCVGLTSTDPLHSDVTFIYVCIIMVAAILGVRNVLPLLRER